MSARPPDDARIFRAYIVESPDDQLFGSPDRLFAELDDDRIHYVFSFYREEIKINPEDYQGCTLREAQDKYQSGRRLP